MEASQGVIIAMTAYGAKACWQAIGAAAYHDIYST